MADKDVFKNTQTAWWRPAAMMFARSSAWIAAPIVIALFIGKWLDNKYNSAPWLMLVCIGVAFAVSMVGLVKETVSEYKRIDQAGKNDNRK